MLHDRVAQNVLHQFTTDRCKWDWTIVYSITTIFVLNIGVTLILLLTSHEEYGQYLSYHGNNFKRIGAISVVRYFRTQAGILSDPDAFFVSTSLSSSWIPTVEIKIGALLDRVTCTLRHITQISLYKDWIFRPLLWCYATLCHLQWAVWSLRNVLMYLQIFVVWISLAIKQVVLVALMDWINFLDDFILKLIIFSYVSSVWYCFALS